MIENLGLKRGDSKRKYNFHGTEEWYFSGRLPRLGCSSTFTFSPGTAFFAATPQTTPARARTRSVLRGIRCNRLRELIDESQKARLCW